MTEQDHRCRQGARCRARVRDGDEFVGAGIERPGLCRACEESAFASIARLADDYVALDGSLSEPRDGAEQGPYVRRSSEYGVPIRLDCDVLGTAIVTELIRWTRAVGFDEDLPGKTADCVRKCVSLLLTRLGTLVDLPVRRRPELMPHPQGGDYLGAVEMDGVDAVLRLAELHRDAQRALGVSETRTLLSDPCPAAGCGRRTLAASPDQQTVTCLHCRTTWPKEHFALLGNVLQQERTA